MEVAEKGRVFSIGAFDFKKVGGLAIPVWGGHAPDGGPVGLLKVVGIGVEEAIFSKEVLHDSDDEPIAPHFDGLVFGAFECDGGFGNTRRGDMERGSG